MPKCQYKYQSNFPPVDFACEEWTEGIFCIFHDKDHYTEHKKEANKRFERKVLESNIGNTPLECIGYYLPGIEFAKSFTENFLQPVYFNKAVFYEEANFSRAKFCERANFGEATFSKEANFLGVKFSNEANFSRAKFFGETYYPGAAYFVEAQFYGKASFYEANFSGAAHFGLANFSEGVDLSKAKFFKEAMFTQASFKEAHFCEAKFSELANFTGANFKGADFSRANFSGTAYFKLAEFIGEAHFNYVLFEDGKKIWFEVEDVTKVDFLNTDITRFRFSDRAKWGENDRFKVIEEQWLEGYVKDISLRKKDKKLGEKTKEYSKVIVIPPQEYEIEKIRLEDVMTVYRNLRENYEFRLRYEEAGKFFIKEMELKRKYRNVLSKSGEGFEIKENDWFRKHFSLTGLYYHLSRYGESISRPTLIGTIIVVLSTLFWLTQSNPILEPHLRFTDDSTSYFIGMNQSGNLTHWLKSFERSFADFLPLLSLGGNIKVGIIDYIIKIVGGALTFGLLAIALRRKFERKYTR